MEDRSHKAFGRGYEKRKETGKGELRHVGEYQFRKM